MLLVANLQVTLVRRMCFRNFAPLEQRIPPRFDPWMQLLFLVLRLLEKRWLRIPFHEQCGSDQPPAQSKLEYDYALPNTLVSHEQDVNHCG